MSKKKARRYAEQDEEDRGLALLALGHKAAASSAQAQAQAEAGRGGGGGGGQGKDKDKARRDKAGVGLLTAGAWTKAVGLLSPAVKRALDALLHGENQGEGQDQDQDQGKGKGEDKGENQDQGEGKGQGQGESKPPLLAEGEIGADEVTQLAALGEEAGLAVLVLFAGEGGVNLQKKGNKSAFLAGVIRRYAKEHGLAGAGGRAPKPGSSKAGPKSAGSAGSAGSAASSAASAAGQAEGEGEGEGEGEADRALIQSILEEEGILEEEEGRQADEQEKLSGLVLPEDVLLYAVPVVGPYSALRNFKFKVKLTPGVMKKGKVGKTAVEAWLRLRECGERERGLIRGMTDPEIVAQLIGDSRVSMPGLHGSGTAKAKKQQRGQKKGTS